MNREQMTEKAAQIMGGLPYEEFSEEGRNRRRGWATDILNAILPQVTTVAELEALPVRALLLCEFGDTFVVDRDSRAPDFRFLAPNGERWTADGLIEVYGRLTVVWTPEAVS